MVRRSQDIRVQGLLPEEPGRFVIPVVVVDQTRPARVGVSDRHRHTRAKHPQARIDPFALRWYAMIRAELDLHQPGDSAGVGLGQNPRERFRRIHHTLVVAATDENHVLARAVRIMQRAEYIPAGAWVPQVQKGVPLPVERFDEPAGHEIAQDNGVAPGQDVGHLNLLGIDDREVDAGPFLDSGLELPGDVGVGRATRARDDHSLRVTVSDEGRLDMVVAGCQFSRARLRVGCEHANWSGRHDPHKRDIRHTDPLAEASVPYQGQFPCPIH